MKKLYGLIGCRLGHSFSRQYHNARFEQEGIDAEYCNYELPEIALLTELVQSSPALMGLNVTIPYKECVMLYLDEVDDIAQRIGAVNVIKIYRQNNKVRMVGYNSDYIGFRNSIIPLLQPQHTHALVLGSGGASKAVSTALRDMGISIQIVSRTPQNDEIGYSDLTANVISRHKIILNTTPLGMYPRVEECAPIPYNFLTEEHLCYDVVYNPEETMFMKRASEFGACVCNGMKMLHGQADAAWEIWNKE